MSEDSTATTQAFPPGRAWGFLGAGTAGSGMASSGTGSSTAATSPHEVARLLKRPKVRRLLRLRMSQRDPQQLCAGRGQLWTLTCTGACCWLDACSTFRWLRTASSTFRWQGTALVQASMHRRGSCPQKMTFWADSLSAGSPCTLQAWLSCTTAIAKWHLLTPQSPNLMLHLQPCRRVSTLSMQAGPGHTPTTSGGTSRPCRCPSTSSNMRTWCGAGSWGGALRVLCTPACI